MRRFLYAVSFVTAMLGTCVSSYSAPMSFTMDGDNILAVGEIVEQTASSFLQFARTNGIRSGNTVYLDSNGGDVDASLALGRIFRAYEFNTIVDAKVTPTEPGNCASACVYVFMGGVTRFVNSNYGLLVHQLTVTRPQPDGTVETDKEIQNARNNAYKHIAQFISEMGVSSDFMGDMLSALPSAVRAISVRRASVLNLTTSAVSTVGQALPWSREITADGHPAHSFYVRGKRMAVIGCRGGIVHLFMVVPNDIAMGDREARSSRWIFATDNTTWPVDIQRTFYDDDRRIVLDIAVGIKFLRALYNARSFDIYTTTPHSILYGTAPYNLKDDVINCEE